MGVGKIRREVEVGKNSIMGGRTFYPGSIKYVGMMPFAKVTHLVKNLLTIYIWKSQ